MASLDYKALNVNVGNLRVIKNTALEIAESKLSSARGDFLESFENHEVTKEIEAGESSSNSTGIYFHLLVSMALINRLKLLKI